MTDYRSGFIYENDELQFVTHEEGRIRIKQVSLGNSETEYDYFVKDHLGNVRAVLTDEIKQDIYPDLNFEGAANSQEVINQDAVWDNRNGAAIDIVSSRTARPGNFGTSTSNGSNVMLVRKSTGAIGATKMLKVMSGDKLNVSVDYYYTATNADNSGAGGYNTFINSLVGILTGSDATGSLVKNNAAAVLSAQSGDANVTNFFSPENTGTTGNNNPPKAYLHVLLFDERFVFDNVNSYVEQVSYTPNTYATIVKAGMNVKKNGYAYIYFSNESNELVYFDNFKLSHERSSLMEETHYYPFGLTMQAISSKAAGTLENKLKYNGKELQSKEFSNGSGLEWTDYGARMYDGQIGRFSLIDPMSDNLVSVSTYSYCFNNPIIYADKDGAIPIVPLLIKAGAAGAADLMTQVAFNYFFNSDTRGNFEKSIEKVNWWQVGRSAIEGLIPWRTPGGAIGKAAATAVGDVIVNAFTTGSSYSIEQAAKDFAIGFIGDLAGSGLGELIQRFGVKNFIEGITMIGLNSQELLSKYAWSLPPTVRGTFIEDVLSVTKYSGWRHIGLENNKYFPGIDFIKDGYGVSVKTTYAKSGFKDIIDNIDMITDALKKGSIGGVELKDAKIEVYVEIGYDTEQLKKIINHALNSGVNLNIQFF